MTDFGRAYRAGTSLNRFEPIEMMVVGWHNMFVVLVERLLKNARRTAGNASSAHEDHALSSFKDTIGLDISFEGIVDHFDAVFINKS